MLEAMYVGHEERQKERIRAIREGGGAGSVAERVRQVRPKVTASLDECVQPRLDLWWLNTGSTSGAQQSLPAQQNTHSRALWAVCACLLLGDKCMIAATLGVKLRGLLIVNTEP